MGQTYKPLHQKYRPTRFDQLVGQEAIATTLENALLRERIAPAYLFSGPRGTGKTSSARILARSLNCLASDNATPTPCGRCELCQSIAAGNALDVIEIDAASNTGVDNIRELIERSRFAPVEARWKVYVVDECHMLSTAAFNALLKTLEEPPRQVVFILATTDPQRILPTILSRCQRFDFRRIPLEALESHLRWIAGKEGITITDEALRVIAQRAQGGLRDAESLLDQLSLLPAPIEAVSVWELLGVVPEKELMVLAQALASVEPLGVVQTSRELLERGREPAAVLQGLVGLLRDLVLAGVAPDHLELTSVSSGLRGQLPELARRIGKSRLLRWQAHLKGSEQQLRRSAQPRLWLEVLLLGLLAEPMAGMASPVSTTGGQATQGPVKESSVQAGPLDVAAPEAAQKKPEPVPALTAPRPEAASADSRPEQNLPALWQQIVARLELPSTRMLLSQQAQLVRLDERRAVVRVASTWMAMVQSRKALVEKALTAALESPRLLELEGGRENQPPTSASAPSPHSQPPPKQPEGQLIRQQPLPPPAHTSQALNESQSHPPQPLSDPGTSAQKQPGSLQDPIQSSALDEKAQRLAAFFHGEVIQNSDDLVA